MSYITDRLGNKIFVTNHQFKTKVLAEGTNVNNLPTSVMLDGKTIIDVYYNTWRGMFRRCKETGDTITTDWYEFSNFKKWASKYSWINKELNHTLLLPGNTHYSPKTCVFVSPSLSKLFTVHSDNELGITGVTLEVDRYRARISIDGKQKHLGRYASSEEAREAYVLAKIADANRIANEYAGDKQIAVRKGLKQHIGLLKQSIN